MSHAAPSKWTQPHLQHGELCLHESLCCSACRQRGRVRGTQKYPWLGLKWDSHHPASSRDAVASWPSQEMVPNRDTKELPRLSIQKPVMCWYLTSPPHLGKCHGSWITFWFQHASTRFRINDKRGVRSPKAMWAWGGQSQPSLCSLLQTEAFQFAVWVSPQGAAAPAHPAMRIVLIALPSPALLLLRLQKQLPPPGPMKSLLLD